MRAVVIQIKENKAAVLMKDGTMRYIDNMGYEQGTVLELPDTETLPDIVPFTGSVKTHAFRLPYRFVSSAAACLVLVTLSGAMVSYACPISSVTVSSDSSITLGVNVYGKVVGINTADPKNETLLKDISKDIAGKNVDYVEKMVSGIIDDNYDNNYNEPSEAANEDEPGTEESSPMIIQDTPVNEEILPSLPTEESYPEISAPSSGNNDDKNDSEEKSGRESGKNGSGNPDNDPSPENRPAPGNSPVIENNPVPENNPGSEETNAPGIIPDQGDNTGSTPEAAPSPAGEINIPPEGSNTNPPTDNGMAPPGDNLGSYGDPGGNTPNDNAPDNNGSEHGEPDHGDSDHGSHANDSSDRGGSDHGTSDHGGSDHGGHGGGPGGR